MVWWQLCPTIMVIMMERVVMVMAMVMADLWHDGRMAWSHVVRFPERLPIGSQTGNLSRWHDDMADLWHGGMKLRSCIGTFGGTPPPTWIVHMLIIIIRMPIVTTIQMTMPMTCRQDMACHSRRLASQECTNTAPTVLTSASLIITLSSASKTWITLHGSYATANFQMSQRSQVSSCAP